MKITYKPSTLAWQEYQTFVTELILKQEVKRVCEVGGGANPTLPLEFVQAQGLEYTIFDLSEEELAKAPERYHKVHADIMSPNLNLNGNYDLVFSKMLAEHVKSGERLHHNIHQLLVSGGRAFHFFPTLYAPPFVINRLLPEELTTRLLNAIQSGRENMGKKGKFPAYYDWCYGPLPSQIERFERAGYYVEEYTGFFGHVGYYEKISVLKKIHEMIVGILLKHPVPLLTSFAYVVLKKK